MGCRDRGFNYRRFEPIKTGGTVQVSGLVCPRETAMPKPTAAETGQQIPARPHDSGSAANETVDGLDATTEELRHAAEDTPTGAEPSDVEKVPVFDRAGAAPKI
jgi:hypothetical protein